MARKPKTITAFGIEVDTFKARSGLSLRTIAEQCGIDYNYLLECKNGNGAGHEVKPKVIAFMENFKKKHPVRFMDNTTRAAWDSYFDSHESQFVKDFLAEYCMEA